MSTTVLFKESRPYSKCDLRFTSLFLHDDLLISCLFEHPVNAKSNLDFPNQEKVLKEKWPS